jgi:hypothetical protein
MNRYVIAGGAILVTFGIGLSAGLGIAAAQDDSNPAPNGSGYMGMMASFGDMNSAAMLARMKEVLGDSAYQQMLQHMQADRSGANPADDPAIDQMMHRIMDGMLGQMPMGNSGIMNSN